MSNHFEKMFWTRAVLLVNGVSFMLTGLWFLFNMAQLGQTLELPLLTPLATQELQVTYSGLQIILGSWFLMGGLKAEWFEWTTKLFVHIIATFFLFRLGSGIANSVLDTAYVQSLLAYELGMLLAILLAIRRDRSKLLTSSSG